MIGRKQEVERLEWACQSPDPEFIGIYGRRRVGKNLVAKTFAGRFAFQHAGLAPRGAEDDDQPAVEGNRKIGMNTVLYSFNWTSALTKKRPCPA